MSASGFHATLADDEAALRFPYDERLRMLLRAIPGRRWDPVERVWRIPLEPEQADALTRLLDGLPAEPDVEPALASKLARRRARRERSRCRIELVRFDADWWLGFASDGPGEPVARLLEHPGARRIEELGRGIVPFDDQARALAGALAGDARVELSPALRARLGEDTAAARPAGSHAARADVEFRRDRRGSHWILIGARGAPLARVLAARAELRPVEGPHGSVGLAAVEAHAQQIGEVLDQLEDVNVDRRVTAWLERATSWRGNIDVGGGEVGSDGGPVFLLLGDAQRLPRAIRDLAASAVGGASLPLSGDSLRLIEEQLEGWLSPAARRCAEALRQGRPAPAAVLELSGAGEEAMFVLAPGHDPSLGRRFAAIPGALRPRQAGPAVVERTALAALRVDPFCVPALDELLVDGRIWIEERALAALQEVREQHARAAGLVALSSAHDAALEVPGLGGELKPFQRAGVSYLLERRRAFLADEQGLGKTIEALATLEAADAYPAVVVCPANLKLNWLREIGAWLPRRTARALRGTAGGRADGREVAAPDITVINYDILGARLDELIAQRPRGFVIDEAHYCKNASARRTQAAQRLAAAVPLEGIVLALSGTPIVNRPEELISQLRILGRLDEFGSGVKFGARFRGADAHQRLHWHLRARCFVRRLKRDVLPQLPAKTRSVVPVELDNEAEYRLAESDLVAWLRSQPLDLRQLDAKVAAALRAERLVRLGALKLLAARGKLNGALAWLHDFCSSGERVVVFARHREIQAAVRERFPQALHILGEDSAAARDEALRAFQAPDREGNQLIVCSLEVAGQGLTLTRASNVAFLELDWTPAKHDQAEDRCHRIGQQDAVNAYYLLAANTVDETIATLLERKRAVIGAVTDGQEQNEESVLDALVRELRGEPYRRLRAVA